MGIRLEIFDFKLERKVQRGSIKTHCTEDRDLSLIDLQGMDRILYKAALIVPIPSVREIQIDRNRAKTQRNFNVFPV